MKLYLVRHGQTDWNIDHIPQGRTDIPLNDVGRKQAKDLKGRIKDLDFDCCYSSPLVRAYETAKIIVGDDNKILLDDSLIERDFGSLEGGALPDDWEKYWRLDRPNLAEGMERLEDVFERTRAFLDKLKRQYEEDAKLLVVGHGGSLKTLYFNIVGYDKNTDLLGVHFKNGEIMELEV